jgi:NADH-quinone oxidoreductase subunit C
MTNLNAIADSLSDALGTKIAGIVLARGELTAEVKAGDIVDVMVWLQGPGGFKILVDICGNDWPQREKRFDVVYHLLSLSKNARIRIKTQLGDGETIASVTSIYPAAGWFEREAFDMYGIAFDGHPDLRRILTDYGFS